MPIWRNTAVCSSDDAGWRVVRRRQLVVGNESCPLMRIVRASGGQGTVAAGSNRYGSVRVVADVAIYIGINEVFTGRREGRQGRVEFLPVGRLVEVDKWVCHRVL